MFGSQWSNFLIRVLSLLRPFTPLRRTQIVVALQADAGDFLDHIDELVDADRFAGPQIDRLDECAEFMIFCTPLRQSSMYMKLRVWFPVPQISISCLPANLRFDHFAANCGRSFFAAAEPGSPRAVDIVESRDARVEAEVFAEVAAHALGEQLFPAITVFSQRGIGVFFFQATALRKSSACRRCKRKPTTNRRSGSTPCFTAACSMWVLISTESMQIALFFSMKPMPPMLAARL